MQILMANSEDSDKIVEKASDVSRDTSGKLSHPRNPYYQSIRVEYAGRNSTLEDIYERR